MREHFVPGKLRAIRQATGLSMDRLAAQSGRGRQTVIRAEMGRVVPTLPVLADFANVLGVDVAEFFERVPDGDR